jgi:predicted ArsR family transcriptional regulator
MANRKVPKTSLEAWRSITQEQLNEHHAKILSGLSMGPASAEQIADRIGLTHHQVNRRMKDLEEKLLAFKNGQIVATKTGRTANVWALVNPNEIPKKVTEKTLPGPSVSDYSKGILKQYVQLNLL